MGRYRFHGIILCLSAYTGMYVGRRVCHEEKRAFGIGSSDRGTAGDPFYFDGFPVRSEQKSGGGEYICGDGEAVKAVGLGSLKKPGKRGTAKRKNISTGWNLMFRRT